MGSLHGFVRALVVIVSVFITALMFIVVYYLIYHIPVVGPIILDSTSDDSND